MLCSSLSRAICSCCSFNSFLCCVMTCCWMACLFSNLLPSGAVQVKPLASPLCRDSWSSAAVGARWRRVTCHGWDGWATVPTGVLFWCTTEASGPEVSDLRWSSYREGNSTDMKKVLYMKKIKATLRSTKSLTGITQIQHRAPFSISVQLNLYWAPGILIYKRQGSDREQGLFIDPSTMNSCISNFIFCSASSVPRALFHYPTPLISHPRNLHHSFFHALSLPRVVNISAGKVFLPGWHTEFRSYDAKRK